MQYKTEAILHLEICASAVSLYPYIILKGSSQRVDPIFTLAIFEL